MEEIGYDDARADGESGLPVGKAGVEHELAGVGGVDSRRQICSLEGLRRYTTGLQTRSTGLESFLMREVAAAFLAVVGGREIVASGIAAAFKRLGWVDSSSFQR